MSAAALADTSTLAHPFLWDDSVCKREVDTRFDCNDLVSSMEAWSAGRSKWIPCHSSLITPALPPPSLFFPSHSIYHFLRSFLCNSEPHSLTQTGSCSGLKSPQRRRRGCWRCWSPPLAKGRLEEECVQVTEPLWFKEKVGGVKEGERVIGNIYNYIICDQIWANLGHYSLHSCAKKQVRHWSSNNEFYSWND